MAEKKMSGTKRWKKPWKKGKARETVTPELERLNRELMGEADRELNEIYQKLIQPYAKPAARGGDLPEDAQVLEPEDAHKILAAMLDAAISRRHLLIGRIKCAIEQGGIIDLYYDRLAAIDRDTILAYEQMQTMFREQQEYEEAKMRCRKMGESVYQDCARVGPVPDEFTKLSCTGIWQAIRRAARGL